MSWEKVVATKLIQGKTEEECKRKMAALKKSDKRKMVALKKSDKKN